MKSKDLITNSLNEAKANLPEAEGGPEDEPIEGFRGPEGFDPGEPPPRRAPGPGMRRPMRGGPGGIGGPGGPGGPPGMLNPRERDAFKGIIMFELLNMIGRDQYYLSLIKTALSGKDPDPGQIRHVLDEAGRIADLLDENQRALLDKFSRMPQH